MRQRKRHSAMHSPVCTGWCIMRKEAVMFTDATRNAMIALAAVDPGVTAAEWEALSSLLSGQPAGERARKCGIVKYADAARRLGVSVQSIKRMAQNGLLRRVSTGGPRACGVTEESLVGLSGGDRDGFTGNGERRYA